MFSVRSPVFWFGVVVAFTLALFLVRAVFDPDARARRRRHRSHGRVVSRRQGPSVRLLVNVDKSKRDRKD